MFLEVSRNGQPSVGDLIRIRDSAYATDMFIAAVAGLDFFTWITRHPGNRESICQGLGLAARPVAAMLAQFEAWGLIRNESGSFAATEVAKRYLNADSPDHFLPYITSLRGRPSVREMLALLRNDRVADWDPGEGDQLQEWDRLMQTEAFAKDYTDAMDRRGLVFGPPLQATLDCSDFHRLLDVAGGSGVYTAYLLERYPHLTATVLERPPVDKLARDALARQGLSGRVSVHSADMFKDPLPEGHDLHFYSHVLHNWPEEKVRSLIGKSYAALDPGGAMAIFSSHMNDQADGPCPGPMAEYSVLLAFLYPGRCYSVGETWDMLSDAGFEYPEWHPTECHRSVILARKPA